jgi:glycosyltransferase involved in cell wall biosynthesis
MMKPVPVLYLIHSLGHGGSERQLAAVAMTLDRTRFTPHAASVLDGFRAEEMRQDGIPVWTLPLRTYFGASTLTALRQLCGYISREKVELVHTFDYSLSPLGVAAARVCPGVRVLSSQRCNMELVPLKYRHLLMASHWMADGIIVNCEELRRHLHEEYKYPASRIEVCWNGIDIGRFHPSERKRLHEVRDAALVVGSACVLRAEKALNLLLKSFAEVRKAATGMKLLIVGSGPEEEALRALAGRLGITPQCCFLPSTAEVTAALSSIDIFVHPSLSEGLPNAVMEAMACGCAVAASRVGGCPELIEDGVQGLLFRPGDLDGMVAALRTLIAQPELRRKMADAASARIREQFSISASASRMSDIYERLLKRERGAA